MPRTWRFLDFLTKREFLVHVPTIHADPKHFVGLFRVISDAVKWQEQYPEERITFDFSRCNFLQQNGVVLIGGFARLLENAGTEVRFRWDTLHPDVGVNLCRNGFLSAFGRKEYAPKGNTIPYREHGFPEKDEVLPYLEREWLNRGWISLDPDVKAGILGNLWEVYANAGEHAYSTVGVITCGQYFPTRRKVRIAIADFGVGIVHNVRQYAENPNLPARKAMRWAFQPMTSTKLGGRGLGLSTVKELIRVNGGQLHVYSNDGHCAIDRDGEHFAEMEVGFNGTIVTIELRYDAQCTYSYATSKRGRRKG